MAAALRLFGVDNLLKEIERLAPELTRAASAFQQTRAVEAAAEIRAAYPSDTGQLRNSVRVARLSSTSSARVFTQITVDAPYAHFVEFGTARTAPNPAFVPITRRLREQFVRDVIGLVEARGLVVGGELRNG